MINKFICFALLLFAFSIININESKASHVAGSDITYQYLGSDSFLVTLRIFEDCGGAVAVGPNETVTFVSAVCGLTFTASLPQISVTEVSQLCPSEQINSTCNGGSLPGMREKVFQGIVELGICEDWIMGWGVCCRNPTDNLDPTGALAFLITANLNRVKAPENNSPYFNAQPIPYVCANQVVNYNFGVTEADGDSLVYRFADPYAGTVAGITVLGYVNGATTLQPITGITLDSLTGIITFTPTVQGNFVLVVEVTEYDEFNNILGVVRRDIQFVVTACSNNVPDFNVGQISNFFGTALQTGSYSLVMCEGENFSFNAVYTDIDVTDSLIITTNASQVLPGIVVTTSGFNPLLVNFSWTAPSGSSYNNTNFSVAVNDQSCPTPGLQTFTYVIDVVPSTYITAGSNAAFCQGDSLHLFALGGTVFNWFDLNGNPIPVGPEFSCNPCFDPVVRPNTTTTYVVQSDLLTSCVSRDTITVVVAPNFQINASTADTSICTQQIVQFSSQIINGNAGPYSYNWSPTSIISNSNSSSPTGFFTSSGIIPIYLEVSNPQGCVRQDSIQMLVSPAVGFILNAYADAACVGDTVQLNLDLQGQVNNACGLTTDTCSGPIFTTTSGDTLSNSVNSIIDPGPYGSINKTTKMQFLYRGIDLNNLGFVGGKINALAFKNNAIQAAGPVFHNYTIKMKCTSATSLGPDFDTTGLATVYDPKDFTIGLGLNNHVLDYLYEWDGFSNLLIEICFDNIGFFNSGTLSAGTVYTATSYNSVLFVASANTNVCGALTPANTPGSIINTSLPNIQFSYCNSIPNINSFNVVWSPTTYLQNLNSFNPISVPPGDTLYTVEITNSLGCSTTDTVAVNYNSSSFQPTLLSDSTFCSNSPIDTLQALPSGGTWAGAFISPEGYFNPAAAGIGIFPVTYYVGSGTACADSLTVNLVVGTPLNTTITPPAQTTYCSTDPAITLTAATAGGTWSGPGVNSSTGEFNPSLAGAGNHIITYSITVPCLSSSSITINVIAGPVFSIQALSAYCITSPPIDLGYAPLGASELWSGPGITNTATGIFNPAVAGIGSHSISLTIENAAGCAATQTTIINVVTPPDPSISISTNQFCVNDGPVQISAVTPGGTFSGSTGVSATGLFTPANATIGVNAIVYNTGGACPTLSDTLFITVLNFPAAPVVSQSDTVCEGNTLIDAISGVAPSGTISWYADSSLTNLYNTGNIFTGSVTQASTIYVVVEANGCSSAVLDYDVIFYPGVVASFTTNPATPVGPVPLTVSFTHTYVGNPDFIWDFGDGSPLDSTNIDPTHVFNDSTVAIVILTITNAQGCTDTATATVTPEEKLIIPNVFTPNGDGTNDQFYFKVAETAVKSFNATIFDRWGKKVFTFSSVKDKWDGGDFPAGTYYYTIDAVLSNGEPFKPASGFFQMNK
jgi:gliding motility-associated-like protein